MKIKYFGGAKPYILVESTMSEQMLSTCISFELILGELLDKFGIPQEYEEKLRTAVEQIKEQSANDALFSGYKCALLGGEVINSLLVDNPKEAAFTIV